MEMPLKVSQLSLDYGEQSRVEVHRRKSLFLAEPIHLNARCRGFYISEWKLAMSIQGPDPQKNLG